MLIVILIVQLLTVGGHTGIGHRAGNGPLVERCNPVSESSFATIGDPGFLGFRLGMKAPAVLRRVGKNPNALHRVKAHFGQRVISDTVSLTACKLPMRRSLGFDSTGALTAVGLTYKTTPDRISEAKICAYQWLLNLYGPATNEAIRDSTKQEVWKLGPVRITLEAKGYNEKDYFVLIYYYKASDTPQ